MLLCNNAWEQKNVIELFDIGLEREEYNKLKEEEKVMRAKALRKIIKYWCTDKIHAKIEEAFFVLQLCDVFLVEGSDLLIGEYLSILMQEKIEFSSELIPEAYRKLHNECKKRARNTEERSE